LDGPIRGNTQSWKPQYILLKLQLCDSDFFKDRRGRGGGDGANQATTLETCEGDDP